MKKNYGMFVVVLLSIMSIAKLAHAEGGDPLTSIISGWVTQLGGYNTAALAIAATLFAIYAGFKIAKRMLGAR